MNLNSNQARIARRLIAMSADMIEISRALSDRKKGVIAKLGECDRELQRENVALAAARRYGGSAFMTEEQRKGYTRGSEERVQLLTEERDLLRAEHHQLDSRAEAHSLDAQQAGLLAERLVLHLGSRNDIRPTFSSFRAREAGINAEQRAVTDQPY